MPEFTLNYFNGRGRAEITRLIFTAAGAKFTDNRIADWPATKAETPLGQLPYLAVDNVKLPQSIAIARYVAREFNLAGRNNLEQAQADAIVDTILDLVNFYYSKVFPIQDATEKAEAFQKFLADQGAKGAANLETLIGLYGSNGHAVGDALTWADLAIFDVTSVLFSKHPTFGSSYPRLSAVHSTVNNHAVIAEYVKNRPETPF